MSSEKRAGSPMILAGLGGFLLGAATVLFILWLYKTPAGQDSGAVAGGEAPPPVVAAPEGEEPVTPSTSVTCAPRRSTRGGAAR